MKPIRIALFVFAALIACCSPLAAQNQVSVMVNLSPPYSHRFADYTEYQVQVFLTLTNTTQQSLQMKILGDITGQGTGFFLRTRPDYVPNQIITLSPGESRQFRGDELNGYFDRNNTQDNISDQLETDILRSGLLPHDVYEYCIEVVEINTLELLGRRCTFLPIQYLSPPQTNLPQCGEPYSLTISPVINFSWLPPVGGGMGNANLRYDFYLLPAPEGQDPAQLLDLAMDGQPIGYVFNWPDIIGTNFQYNTLQLPPLQPGRYVWGVVARDISRMVGIENEGKSQFCTILIEEGNDPNNLAGGNNGDVDFRVDCACKSPAQAPGGAAANELLQPGTDIQVGFYTMRVLSTDGNGNGSGRIAMPGFPGGVSLPILVNFTGLDINSDRKMIAGMVRAQVKSDAGFLPEIVDPQLATLPLGTSEIGQLDQYFAQNAGQLMSQIGNGLDASGYKLPLGLDKSIGGQQVVVAITGLQFDATRAAMDAAVVLNLVDAGTKIALSGRGICLKDGLGLCGEAELYLAENLELPAINMGLRGLQGAQNPNQATRVRFDKDGFKNLHIEAFYRFSAQTLTKLQGGGQVEATLTADTDKGWSDWVATIGMDAFRINGVNDFAFHPGTAVYDHSSSSNPSNMPGDYAEGQSPTWMGFFLQTMQVDLPPIIKNRHTNQALSASANNIIIDGNGVTGSLNLNNILAIGDGGSENWQFSVNRFTVKFLKNTFQSGGFEGHLLLPITSRGVQSQLIYSSLLSYTNGQFAYNFVVQPRSDLEVDLFAAMFVLAQNSNITIAYSGVDGFEASARLSGEFSIGGKFINDLPRIQLAEVHFQNLGLTTRSPFYTPGQIQASLGSPPKSVGGFPFNVSKWELVTIGLKATVDMQLSDHIGFLPNAKTAFTIFGKFEGSTPEFDRFELNRIEIDADFSVLHVKGGLEFFSKDPMWGDGFQGTVDAIFPPGFEVESRIQVGDKAGVDYWYVDGKTHFGGSGEDFAAGMDAYGFSGGGCYNMEMLNFQEESDITETIAPEAISLGSTPSGINYRVKNGASAVRASLVFGLGSKELFNVNGSMAVTFSEGGVDVFTVGGKGRMFGNPGSTGMMNGGFSILYDFPQQILRLHIDMEMNFAVFKGRGSLDTYSNGTNGDWHFKLGRPMDYGSPCALEFKMPPLDIRASAYFQAGNFEVDGLPTRLPEVMMRLFPDYATRYGRTDRSRTQRGNAILLGLSLEASFQQNYLIFYGRLRGAFGFDLLMQKVQGGCNGRDQIGMDGWYGNGQFYAGIEASIGIEVDLFFISGKFEILAVGFGGLLTGGGPEPTWMKGEVGGFYSILGGLVEGHCSFDFSVGDICVPENDPLAALKVINEIEPKPRSQSDPQVDELQEIFLEPAASVNLRMGREFFLEETKVVNDEAQTIPRLFKFDREDLKVTMRVDKPNTAPIEITLEYDADGYGMLASPNQYLTPETDYIVTFTANVKECRTESISTYSSQTIAAEGYSILKSGTCNGGGWSLAKLANGQPFKEERQIKFTTNGGPMRLDPKQVIYSLPHHGQRFYCYGDFTQQAILAMDDDKERVMTADLFFRPDRANTSNPRLKLRLVPSGANADALDALEIEVKAGGIYDPSLDQGPFGQSKYLATQAQNYWIAPLLRTLAPDVTYGAQFFLEWDVPPTPENPNNPNAGRMATTMKQTVVARGMATITERELNLRKYRLKSNQREVYRYHFKASQYSSIERKINALERNQLVYKQIRPGEELILSSEITAPASRDWNLVAQRLQQIYPPEALNPVRDRNAGAQGVFLSKAGYDGPEKFDIFDVYGFEKTIGNKRYQVQPLISLDGDELINWWREQFNQAETILLQNGIREAYLPAPGIERSGWIFKEPVLKINGVMDSITTSGALGNGNPSMLSTLNMSNPQTFLSTNNQNNSMVQNIMASSDNHLLEVRRDVERMMGTVPGAMPPSMNWLNNMMNGGWMGGWVGASDGPMNDQLMTNIGMSYDFVGSLQQPGISIPSIGTSGGGIHINAMQGINAPRAGMMQLGN